MKGYTIMKARTMGRHLRESLKSLGRNSWMTFASVSAVTVTLSARRGVHRHHDELEPIGG